MKNKDYNFFKKWKKEQKGKIKLLRPDLSDDTIEKYLEKKIEENFKDHSCTIRNTYKGKEVQSSLLNITEFIHQYNPILGGYGILFDPKKPNPSAKMLEDKLAARKKEKKARDQYDKRSFEWLMKNIAQDNIKRTVNSYYGSSGAKSSIFYNKDLASSVTSSGQAEISTSMTSFEMLIANNMKFVDLDEGLRYIHLILHKKEYFLNIPYINNIREKSFDYIFNSFIIKSDLIKQALELIYDNLTKEDMTKLYLINNLKAAFLEIPKLNKLTRKILNETKSFRDPNEPPKEIIKDMEEIWEIIKEFVVFNYPIRNRIDRDRFSKRKTIVTQDTDSTMISMYDLKDFLIENLCEDEVAADNMEEFTYLIINFCCYILITKYCRLFLDRYCRIANIPENLWGKINMKNEFYYPRMLLTRAKKHYITLTKLQEGKEINPPLVELHGLEIAKSETSLKTREFFQKIIEEDIMTVDEIDISKIIAKIFAFKHVIQASLESGNPEFLQTISVKEDRAYKEPLSEQGVRAVKLWNALYPTEQFQLPDKVLGLHLVTKKLSDYEKFSKNIPPKFDALIREMTFNSPEKSFANNGFGIIALPQGIEKIPEWLEPMINFNKIIQSNVSKFNSILESLGVVLLKVKSNKPAYTSNLIKI